MNDSHNYGDQVTQYGDHSIGIIKSQGALGSPAPLVELAAAVNALKGSLPAHDQAIIDNSMHALADGPKPRKKAMRQALRTVAEVASTVGQVGVPVIELSRKVMEALGL